MACVGEFAQLNYPRSTRHTRSSEDRGFGAEEHLNECTILTMLLEEIQDLRQAGVLVHRHHAVRKNPYPELRNGIVEKPSLLPKRCHEELRSKRRHRRHEHDGT